MRNLGVDEMFIDKASGKNVDRPELRRMMEYVRKGDTVVVEAISRFARNTRDLLELVEKLTNKNVEFIVASAMKQLEVSKTQFYRIAKKYFLSQYHTE